MSISTCSVIMPNWCSNHLVISGDAKQIAKLTKKIVVPYPKNSNEMIFDFNGIRPMPEDLLPDTWYTLDMNGNFAVCVQTI